MYVVVLPRSACVLTFRVDLLTIKGNARTIVLIFMSREGEPSERWLFHFDDVEEMGKNFNDRQKMDP